MENLLKALKTEDAARFLGVCSRTLVRWRGKGGGPAYIKHGKGFRYRQEVLEDFAKYGNNEEIDQFAIDCATEMLSMAEDIKNGKEIDLDEAVKHLQFGGEAIIEKINFMKMMGV